MIFGGNFKLEFSDEIVRWHDYRIEIWKQQAKFTWNDYNQPDMGKHTFIKYFEKCMDV